MIFTFCSFFLFLLPVRLMTTPPFLLADMLTLVQASAALSRDYSSVHTQQPAGPIREYKIDPYMLLEDELKYIFEDIRQVSIEFFKFNFFSSPQTNPSSHTRFTRWKWLNFCQSHESCFQIKNFGEFIETAPCFPEERKKTNHETTALTARAIRSRAG